MTAQPSLSAVPLWDRHERRVLDVVRRALVLLAERLPLSGEPALNRELYLCMLHANQQIYREGGDYLDHAPVWEARNPPTPDTLGSPSERKIPDFYFGILDHAATEARRGVRNFVVECKRLGPETASGWNFNAQYIDAGVRRFVDADWRYGKDVASGAMVGYVEMMDLSDALIEVNASSIAQGLPALVPTGDSQSIRELMQVLTRPFEVSPFRLVHVWMH